MEATITQTRTSAPTTETKVFPVPSFWKEDKYYPKFYALIAPDLVILITKLSDGTKPSIAIQDKLYSSDTFETQIQADEFSAEYESAQLAITDAFQSAFPSIGADPIQTADPKVEVLLNALTAIQQKTGRYPVEIYPAEVAESALTYFFADHSPITAQ